MPKVFSMFNFFEINWTRNWRQWREEKDKRDCDLRKREKKKTSNGKKCLRIAGKLV